MKRRRTFLILWSDDLLFCLLLCAAIGRTVANCNTTCNNSTSGCTSTLSQRNVHVGIAPSFLCLSSSQCGFDSSSVVVPTQQYPLNLLKGTSLAFTLDSIGIQSNSNTSVYLLTDEVDYEGCRLNGVQLIASVKHPQSLVLPEWLTSTPGTYLLVFDAGNLFNCLFGARINVTIEPHSCVAEGENATTMCSNYGVCNRAKNNTCDCCSTHVGRFCEEFNGCSSSPCNNEGNCTDVVMGTVALDFHCACSIYYTGSQCQDAVDYCSNVTCLNNGTCRNDFHVGNFSCECPLGYTGIYCELDIQECASQPCRNNGSCIDEIGSFGCQCEAGWNGTTCETDVNECDSLLSCANNGSCTNTQGGFLCYCMDGFTGLRCENDAIDDCVSNPCLNNATCVDLFKDFNCSCVTGFTGKLCAEDVDECGMTLCGDGTLSCVNTIGSFKCNCMAGYSGNLCETVINKCDPSPCLNGGLCVNSINDYTCVCQAGYQGAHCERVANKCLYEPCANNATCTRAGDFLLDYHCACPPGWTGKNCTEDYDDCISSPCSNGGTCHDGFNTFNCTCSAGWQGNTCDDNIDMCLENPCKNNAICDDDIIGLQYTCNCLPGFTGKNCSININDCGTVDCNNGTCLDLVLGYRCECNSGYYGHHCDTDRDMCALKPCLHGACENVNTDLGYVCTCFSGWEGINCSVNTDDCVGSPCQNGGTCNDYINFYNCTCAPGFEGARCQIDKDECVSSPCKNNATCLDLINKFKCLCTNGFQGTFCEINIDDCQSSPCQNNATCVDEIDMFHCSCEPGYFGTKCEHHVCDNSPCQHGSTCLKTSNGYECNCVKGFTGLNCSVNINECSSHPCFNNGTCIDGINNYTCQCPTGYSGQHCEDDLCKLGICQNNGKCLVDNGTLSCSCQSGFSGAFCGVDIDDCQLALCSKNGTLQCTDLVDSYTCICHPGFAGTFCESHLCVFDSPCQNGAMCLPLQDSPQYKCNCRPGYSGVNCSIDIDDCASEPCMGNATCIDVVNGFTCHCPPFYTGKQCETDLDFCRRNPCLNNGSCFNNLDKSVTNFTCSCQVGYFGVYCQHHMCDSADTNPCQNQSICVRSSTLGYECVCQSGFEGQNCTDKVNECSSLPCLNGGTCIDLLANYSCSCHHNITGRNCEIQLDYCSNSPCKNNGECHNDFENVTFVCTCPSHFGGKSCDIHTCDQNNPCQNGATCLRDPSGPSCVCLSGYTGKNCSEDINECNSNTCSNNGTCVDLINDYKCNCLKEFTGKSCENNLSFCDGNPCRNSGTCMNDFLGNTYRCVCPSYVTGLRCEILNEPCLLNPCSGKGNCTNLDLTSFQCDCFLGYYGTRCEGISCPCENDGRCVSHDGIVRCVCPVGYSGIRCETFVGDCRNGSNDALKCLRGSCIESSEGYVCKCPTVLQGHQCGIFGGCYKNPCNNGTCLDVGNEPNFKCQCDPGFTGQFCTFDINECTSNPCQYGGTCREESIDAYTCYCLPGYNGTNCEQFINPSESSTKLTRSIFTGSSASSAEELSPLESPTPALSMIPTFSSQLSSIYLKDSRSTLHPHISTLHSTNRVSVKATAAASHWSTSNVLHQLSVSLSTDLHYEPISSFSHAATPSNFHLTASNSFDPHATKASSIHTSLFSSSLDLQRSVPVAYHSSAASPSVANTDPSFTSNSIEVPVTSPSLFYSTSLSQSIVTHRSQSSIISGSVLSKFSVSYALSVEHLSTALINSTVSLLLNGASSISDRVFQQSSLPSTGMVSNTMLFLSSFELSLYSFTSTALGSQHNSDTPHISSDNLFTSWLPSHLTTPSASQPLLVVTDKPATDTLVTPQMTGASYLSSMSFHSAGIDVATIDSVSSRYKSLSYTEPLISAEPPDTSLLPSIETTAHDLSTSLNFDSTFHYVPTAVMSTHQMLSVEKTVSLSDIFSSATHVRHTTVDGLMGSYMVLSLSPNSASHITSYAGIDHSGISRSTHSQDHSIDTVMTILLSSINTSSLTSFNSQWFTTESLFTSLEIPHSTVIASTSIDVIGICSSNPCWNNGQCLTNGSSFVCQCTFGFTGLYCQLYSCSCSNSGRCVRNASDVYQCICQVGFEGENCERFVGDCRTQNCSGHGQCIQRLQGYVCECNAPYSGPSCNVSVRACNPDPCQNGGICISDAASPNKHSCACPPGYQGKACEFDYNECAITPCMNGGQCREEVINSFVCYCNDSATGRYCENFLQNSNQSMSLTLRPSTQTLMGHTAYTTDVLTISSIGKGDTDSLSLSSNSTVFHLTTDSYFFSSFKNILISSSPTILYQPSRRVFSSLSLVDSITTRLTSNADNKNTASKYITSVRAAENETSIYSILNSLSVATLTASNDNVVSSILLSYSGSFTGKSSDSSVFNRSPSETSSVARTLNVSTAATTIDLGLSSNPRTPKSTDSIRYTKTRVHSVSEMSEQIVGSTPELRTTVPTLSASAIVKTSKLSSSYEEGSHFSIEITKSFSQVVSSSSISPTAIPIQNLTCSDSPCHGQMCLDANLDALLFHCICPFPTFLPRCQADLVVHFPRFHGDSYMIFSNVTFEEVINTIVLTFRTSLSNGLLLFAGHSSYQDFIHLHVLDGRLEFRCSAGEGIMKVTNEVMVNTSSLISVIISHDSRSGAVTMIVNGNQSSATPILSRLKSIQLTTPWYLGGFASLPLASSADQLATSVNFTGCIKDFQVNEVPYRLLDATDWQSISECDINACARGACLNNAKCVQGMEAQEYSCECAPGYRGKDCNLKIDHCQGDPCNGGICAWSETGHVCLCQYGRHGIDCKQELNISIPTFSSFSNYSSYVEYPWQKTFKTAAERFEIRLQFKVKHRIADGKQNYLLAFGGQSAFGSKYDDFFALGLIRNRTVLVFNLGGGVGVLVSKQPLSDTRPWHSVTVGRMHQYGFMYTDDQETVRASSPGVLVGLDAYTSLFIGGVPEFKQLPSHAHAYFFRGFSGSIFDVAIRTTQLEFQSLSTLSLSTAGSSIAGIPVGSGLNVGDDTIDECSRQPCENNGTCISQGATFVCRCTDGWKGMLCHDRVMPCIEYNPCRAGSICRANGHGVACDCQLGWAGAYCSKRIIVEVPYLQNSSFIGLSPLLTKIRYQTKIIIEFRPLSSNGLLFYVSYNNVAGGGDFFAISLWNGYIYVRYFLGSGIASIRSRDIILIGQWHRVTVDRRYKDTVLQVDSGPLVGGRSSGVSNALDVRSLLYVGGLPVLSELDTRAVKDFSSQRDFVGCIRQVKVNDVDFALNQTRSMIGRNIWNCHEQCMDSICQHGGSCRSFSSSSHLQCDCPIGWNGDKCQSAVGNYSQIRLEGTGYIHYRNPNRSAKRDTNLEVTFNTTTDGLLMWMGQQMSLTKDYLAIGIVQKRLKITFHIDGLTNEAHLQSNVGNGTEHTLRIIRSGPVVYIFLDGFMPHPLLLSSIDPTLKNDGHAFIGGLPGDVWHATNGKYRLGFHGCIKDIKLNAQSKYLDLFSPNVDGINVLQCS